MTNLIGIIVACLVQIESGGNPSALGDYKDGEPRAVGILQQWECSVLEANRIDAIYARREGREARFWTLTDRLDPDKSRAMAEITLTYHRDRGITNAVDLACRWHCPFRAECHEVYRGKVRRVLDRLQKHNTTREDGR